MAEISKTYMYVAWIMLWLTFTHPTLCETSCTPTECANYEDQSTTSFKILQNLTTQMLQNKFNIHITHSYQNSTSSPNDDTDRSTVKPSTLPQDCNEIFSSGNISSGIYRIEPQTPQELYAKNTSTPVYVYCDMNTDGGPWTVFQKRHDGQVGFFRDWQAYRNGFGYVDGDYWLGLQNLHLLTSAASYELRVDLEDFDGNIAYAAYSSFQIGDESTYFQLKLGDYRGTAGDSLTYHNYESFSTKDQDHDSSAGNHCSQERRGAWWHNACAYSNLNGLYEGPSSSSSTGMAWYYWDNSWKVLKKSEMKIRRTD